MEIPVRFALFILGATLTGTLSAQTFTTLHSFSGADGANPRGALIQATDGNLYGATKFGGASSEGAIYKITTSGAFTPFYSFCAQSGCADGSEPIAALLEASNGNFYGTTYFGGAINSGAVFTITPGGALTTLHSFPNGGGYPVAALIQATSGNLYGTAYWGPNAGWGSIFEMTLSGALTTLYDFCLHSGACPDGANPEQMIQGTDGNFYGTDFIGGPPAGGTGTIFRFTPGSTPVTLHKFCPDYPICAGGGNPYGGLVQAANGDFYGQAGGGSYDHGLFFRMKPNGTFEPLYSFCAQTGCPDGAFPYAVLVQATDGNLYGVASQGGAYDGGTIFSMTPEGALTTLYSFCAQSGCPDGKLPMTALVQDTDGDFYGTTFFGGADDNGVVYKFSTGLAPFVKSQPTAADAGAAVNILGTNLTGATSVTFNGVPAAFTVASPALITTTAPAGATNGRIQVVTPNRTLPSNVPFRVLP